MDVARSSLSLARGQTWRWVSWLPGSMLLATALLFTARRFTGALEQPLPTTTLLAAVVAASLAAMVTIRAVDVTQAVGWCVASVAAGAVVMLGATLSLPGTSSTSLVVLWLLTSTMVGLIARDVLVRGRAGKLPAVESLRRIAASTPKTDNPTSPLDEIDDHRNMWQQLSRVRTEDGEDQLQGWVRVDCTVGQRGEVVHLAFCPPFARIPKLEATCHSGPTARIKVAQLLPHAARIELKLDATPREQTSLVVELLATCPSSDTSHGVD